MRVVMIVVMAFAALFMVMIVRMVVRMIMVTVVVFVRMLLTGLQQRADQIVAMLFRQAVNDVADDERGNETEAATQGDHLITRQPVQTASVTRKCRPGAG